jgi:hypothetical protein
VIESVGILPSPHDGPSSTIDVVLVDQTPTLKLSIPEYLYTGGSKIVLVVSSRETPTHFLRTDYAAKLLNVLSSGVPVPDHGVKPLV